MNRGVNFFVKIQKKKWGGGGRVGVRMDLNEELKFLWGWVGGLGWGVRVDVNREVKFL